MAGSICARTSAIGFGVGLGVERTVAVGTDEALGVEIAVVATAAVVEAVGLTTDPGAASHATHSINTNAATALIVLG